MSRHLSEMEIEEVILHGMNAIAADRKNHLESCEHCSKILQQHLSTDSLLKRIRPLPAGRPVFDAVLAGIRPFARSRNRVKRKDWFLIGAITSLVLTLIISLIKNPLPEILRINLTTGINSLGKKQLPVINRLIDRDIFPEFSFLESLQLESVYTIIIVAIIVLFFYYILDRVLIQRLFQN